MKWIISGSIIGALMLLLLLSISCFVGPFTTPYSEKEIEINKALQPVYYYRPFSIFGQGSVDSLDVVKYKEKQRVKFKDYSLVEKWFQSQDRPLNEFSGNFYKVSEIVERIGDSKEIKDNKEDVLYLFSTNDFFFIINFNINNNSVEPYKISRFSKDYRKAVAHDILWDHKTHKVYKEKALGKYYINFKVHDDDLFFVFETGKNENHLEVSYNLEEDVFYEKEFKSNYGNAMLDSICSILCFILWIISLIGYALFWIFNVSKIGILYVWNLIF